MSILMKIAIVSILLLPDFAFAYEHRGNNRYDNHRYDNHRYDESESNSSLQQGWDINPHRARRATNCYHYTLYVEGGRGSARIMSLPGKNYIQISDGQRSGYVCFNGFTTLELGKLSNTDIYVELDIEDIGTYYFDSGDRGSKLINNWHRSYWGL